MQFPSPQVVLYSIFRTANPQNFKEVVIRTYKSADIIWCYSHLRVLIFYDDLHATPLFLSFCYAPKRPSPFFLYIPTKTLFSTIKYERRHLPSIAKVPVSANNIVPIRTYVSANNISQILIRFILTTAPSIHKLSSVNPSGILSVKELSFG